MANQGPTERELDLLKILWDSEPATVREICERLEQRQTQLAYTTVLSLLQTMERKGLVGHRAAGKAYHYFARVERDRTCQELAGTFLEQVFDGAMDEYLVRAMESRQPSSAELEELEAKIAEFKNRRRATKRGT